MHLEAHFALGWAIGVLAPDSDRRLRNICVVASILPDIDAVTYLWGRETYDVWHHTFGHNIFLGLLVMLGAVWLQRAAPGRQRWWAGALAGLCFGLHLLTDAYFTRYEVYLWWPVNWNGFLIPGGYWVLWLVRAGRSAGDLAAGHAAGHLLAGAGPDRDQRVCATQSLLRNL